MINAVLCADSLTTASTVSSSNSPTTLLLAILFVGALKIVVARVPDVRTFWYGASDFPTEILALCLSSGFAYSILRTATDEWFQRFLLLCIGIAASIYVSRLAQEQYDRNEWMKFSACLLINYAMAIFALFDAFSLYKGL